MHALTASVFAAVLSVIAIPGFAQTSDTDQLFDALGLPQMLEIMRDEGLEYGATIASDMLPGGPTPRWDQIVSDIYDVDRMETRVRASFTAEMQDTDIAPMLAFFTSEPGRTIIGLEVSARRALLDDAVDAASKDHAAIAMMDETGRYLLVKDFVEANDLIETNVVGALNSNYAFYMGLYDGGAMPDGMTPEIALQDVWAQEEEIRSNTVEWVYGFLMLAYQPLSDDDLQSYIAFSQTDAGQELNDAMFGAFNGMFDGISRGLGLASSQFLVSQEL